MDKNAIKKYAVWARNELIARVTQKAEQFGISADADPNADAVRGVLLTKDEKEQRRKLIAKVKEKGFDQVMEEVAYTWFNRFSALRFMEVNNYLPSRVRVFTDAEGAFKPQILTEAIHLDLEGLDMEKVYALKEANDDDALFKYLIITQCNALSKVLPGMFQKIADYTELLFPDNLLREGSVVEQIVTTIPEEDWKDQIQILGWLYQYYNTEPKDIVFAELKKNKKITKDKIPAATQLFTPDWIVRYMVENSLGRLWVEGHPSSDIKSYWNYYLEEAEQDQEVQKLLDEIHKEYASLKPEEIRVIDPCSGSGHVCAYLFDVLMQIYEDYGIQSKEAVRSIIENNLWGLDIDERAAQLAYFSVMMKAVQYDSRFLRRKDENGNPDIPQPHIYAIRESNNIDSFAIEHFVNGSTELKKDMNTLIEEFHDAKEFGSLLSVSHVNFDALYKRIKECNSEINMYHDIIERDIYPLIQEAEALSQKYHSVITNPPYMGNKGFTSKLLTYITKKYKEGKIDLYAAFIKRCSEMTITHGIYAMVTPESWMFLSRFEKLRRPFLESNSLVTLMHLGFGAFDSGFGTVAFSSVKADIRNLKSTCYRLVDFGSTEEKEQALKTEKPYFSTKAAYYMVEGVPICYWVSDAMLSNFTKAKVKDYGKTCVGLLTGNNDRFLRYWFEINFLKLGIGYTHEEAKKAKDKKWFPINQYGEYRKWFGNNMIVFDWENDGYNIKKFKYDRYISGEAEKKNSMCWNEDTYFCAGITWNRISTNKFSARMSPEGNTAGSSSPIYFPIKRSYYLLALFNSCVFSNIVAFLNPTVSFQTTDIEKVPVIFGSSEIDEMAKENVEIAEKDWDSFETSYGFKRNPLV